MKPKKNTPWYVAGLHFTCQGCGDCCSGPGEGVIWVTRPEIELISQHLEMAEGEFRRTYLRRIGIRTSIIEHPQTKDCIFLKEIDGKRKCMIYPLRPNQCRTWPFWAQNLQSPGDWNRAAQRCPGINRGRRHTCDEITEIKKQKQWWTKPDNSKKSSKR